jgi:hypothetical protein
MTRGIQHLTWIVILLLILGLLLLVFAQSGIGTQTTTQSEPNHCLKGGQNFDYPAEIQALAQDAQTYRATHPFGGNYGEGSITLCYSDGSFTVIPSSPPPFEGYNSPSPPENSTHSEWKVFRWAQQQLEQLPTTAGKTVIKIFVAIFSQVRVCGLCRNDMQTWLKDLRVAAENQNVILSIWQIRPGSASAFDPAKNPRGVPTNPTDLQSVQINFTL